MTNAMNDELEQLRRENEQLRKALDEQRQVSVTSPSLINNNEQLISDMCRYSEGLLTKQQVKKKYHYTDADWTQFANDEALLESIEAEKIRRIRNGQAKREKAQQHIVKAPDVLSTIMSDPKSNARHVVDAIKTLDHLADPGPQTAPPADHFVIHIDLTADAKLKGIEPDPADVIVIEAARPTTIANRSDDGDGPI
jgi:hypothetical protein